MQIREDLTVIMVAPKCPGTEVREEYKRGFGVPTLIAVHPVNDPKVKPTPPTPSAPRDRVVVGELSSSRSSSRRPWTSRRSARRRS